MRQAQEPAASSIVAPARVAVNGGLRILLLAADDVSTLRSDLMAAGYSTVDIFDARYATPALSLLLSYDVSIVISNYYFMDPADVGDVVAAYVESGGRVIVGQFCFGSSTPLTGHFLTDGISPFIDGYNTYVTKYLGAYEAGHPLMAGVSGGSEYYSAAVSLSPGAELVASYTDATPLVGVMPGVIGINVYYGAYRVYTGDFFRILLNAVEFNTARWISVKPPIGSIAVHDSTRMTALFDATVPQVMASPGVYTGKFVMAASNSALAETLAIPVRMQVRLPAGARLSVKPDSLDFGDVQQWAAKSLTLRIRNVGADRLVVSDIACGSPLFSIKPKSFALNSLDTADVTVTFAPQDGNVMLSTSLAFASNDSQPHAAPLRGRGVPGVWKVQNSGTFNSLFSVSVVDDQVAWAGGAGGIVLRTTNGGSTWQQSYAGYGDVDNVSARDRFTAFACVNSGYGGNIYRTLDGGNTWSLVQHVGDSVRVNAVQMFDDWTGVALGDPVNHVWKLLKTTDGGDSWQMFSLLGQAGTEFGWPNCFTWISSSTGWFGTTYGRVYRTTNGGASWTYSVCPNVVPIGVWFNDSRNGMIGGQTGYTGRTTNGGAGWGQAASAGTGNFLYPAGVSVPSPRWWMASGNGIYRSSDQGISWTQEHSTSWVFNHIQVRNVPSSGKIVGYAVGGYGQISRYEEANVQQTVTMLVTKRWSLVSVPVAVADYTTTAVYPAASSNAYAYDGSYTVEPVLSKGKGYFLAFDSTQNVRVTGNSRLWDSIQVNAGWNIIGSLTNSVPVSSIVASGTVVTSPYYGYDGSYRIAAALEPGWGYWVKVSANGSLFCASTTALPRTALTGDAQLAKFRKLTVRDAGGSEQTLYFGKQPGRDFSADRFEMPPPAPDPPGLDARFGSGSMVAVIDGQRDVAEPLRVSGAAYPYSVSWYNDAAAPAAIFIDSREIPLRGSGSVRIDRPGASLSLKLFSSPDDMPATFSLEQNYPNPFNPVTVIRYALPVAVSGTSYHVVLKVYDLLGREVATLVDALQSGGRKSVEWNVAGGSGAASGVYLYRLEARGVEDPSASFTDARKLVVVK
jgi:photosystem II stability/assembly factor-like uncharacterized protein